MGWTRHSDGSATNVYGVTGFKAFIEPIRRKRFRYVIRLYDTTISSETLPDSIGVEKRVDAIVANRLSRRRMHMRLHANMLGRWS